MQGHLIVLEGVDGAGTTTHTRRLVDSLQQAQVPVRATQQPSAGPMGALLRMVLGGRLSSAGMSGPRPPAWDTMALMFAADRLDHLENEIIPNLRDGVTIVCDRYYHSSLAYQSVTSGGAPEALEWIKAINSRASAPDLVLVLDVSPDVAAARRRQRGGGEIYDDAELQQRFGTFYSDLETHYPQERIVHIDANASLEEVASAILAQVLNLRDNG